MNSTATCYTRRKSFIPFFKDWWQIVSLISSCIVRTLSFFSDILRVPTAVCVSGSIHQTVHGDCINIQRRVSQHQRDSERDCLSLTHFSLGNVGLSWHMSGNVLLLTLSTFIYAWILLPLTQHYAHPGRLKMGRKKKKRWQCYLLPTMCARFAH